MKIVIPIIALSALIASGVPAWSGSPSAGSLQIKMKIDKECTVNPGGGAVLDFGKHGLVTGDIDGVGAFTIQCTQGVDYTLGLGKGSNWENSQRRMKNDKGDYIVYQLFSSADLKLAWKSYTAPLNPIDSAKAMVLTDKANVDRGALASGKATGAVTSVPVYGRILAKDAASAAIGAYTDTVEVEVRF